LLEHFLNRHEDELNVQLTVMKEEFVSGATLPAKLERIAGEGQGAIVVATPDDVGGIERWNQPPKAGEPERLARVGMVLGTTGTQPPAPAG
jgi:hypothetical protein